MKKGFRVAKSNRVGMGKGKGSGYSNLLPNDPRIHSQSSRGIKQPQKIQIPKQLEHSDFNQKQISNMIALNNAWKFEFSGYKLPTKDTTEIVSVHLTGSGIGGETWQPSQTIEQAYKSYKESGINFGWFDDLIWNPNAKMDKEGYVQFKSISKPHTQFMKDVEGGKVVLKNGLKLSEKQAYKSKPKYEEYNNYHNQKYHKGLVLKISGDYDDALQDKHNTLGVITKVIDPYHFEVKQEGSNKRLIIRDTDVKWWVGDAKYDYLDLGKDRWQSEVLPIVNSVR